MYERWCPFPYEDKRIMVVDKEIQDRKDDVEESRRKILLKTIGTVDAETVAQRRELLGKIFPTSVYWQIIHREHKTITREILLLIHTVTPILTMALTTFAALEMPEGVLRAIWYSLSRRMPDPAGLFAVLVACYKDIPTPLSVAVDHFAASPNLMVLVTLVHWFDVSDLSSSKSDF